MIPLMSCMHCYYENNRVLSRRLKLSVLSVGPRRSSLSEFPGSWAGNSKCPTPIQAETVSKYNEVFKIVQQEVTSEITAMSTTD